MSIAYITSRRLGLFLRTFALTGCFSHGTNEFDPYANRSWEEIMVVASETVVAQGANGPQTCLWVKFRGSTDWQIFYGTIRGFEYESGYEYELVVSIREITNPPQDASSREYTLKSVLSKEKKDSDI